ncbi:MAG TPA: RING finger protein [Planctomycetota bacterium]|nr:RING finger protein [Planctomycetota bacterium]
MNDKKICPQCGQLMAAWARNCPSCGALATAPQQQAAPSLTLQEPGAPSGPDPLPNVQVFPERMKANKVLAERACSSCGRQIELGDDVWNCQSCGNTMHALCHDQVGVCGNTGCVSRPKARVQAPAPYAQAAATAATMQPGEMVPCKYCGEPILKTARKCRFCNEYQNAVDRLNQQKARKGAGNDETLSVLEIVFGLLCGLIPLIVGIVWMTQGKPKGWKLVLLSLISIVVNNIIVFNLRH